MNILKQLQRNDSLTRFLLVMKVVVGFGMVGSVELRKITAKKYNVSKSTVEHIQLGSTWSHLTGIVYKKKWSQKKDG